MSEDGEIIAAAFALRDSSAAEPAISNALAKILPASAADAGSPDQQKQLSDQILGILATDASALSYVRGHMAARKVTLKSISPIDGVPVSLDFYRCPQGDYTWPSFDLSEPVPLCPIHKIALVLQH
ncbi:MAG: hypothetical protein ACLPYS_02125 [Vulcanimicrobiaceae bacterium]